MIRTFQKLAARRTVLLSIPLLLAVLAAMVYVDRQFRAILLQQAQTQLAGQLGEVRTRIEGRVREALVLSRGMEAQWSAYGVLSSADFASLAEDMRRDRPEIRNIAKIENFVVTNVYPLEENRSVLGLDYRTRPDQMQTVSQALQEQRRLVAGPLPLVQGGVGLIQRVPVLDERHSRQAQPLGLISMVLDLGVLFDLSVRELPDVRIAIRQTEGTVLFGAADLFDSHNIPLLLPVLLPNARLELAALPEGGWDRQIGDSLLRFRLLEAVTLVAVVGYGVAFLTYRRRRLRQKQRERILSDLIADKFSSGAFSSPSLDVQLSHVIQFCHDVVEHAPVAVLAYAEDGRCVVANQSAANMVGGEIALLLQQNFRSIVCWHVSGMLGMAEQCLADGQARQGDFYLETPFGRNIWVTCMFTRLNMGERPHLLLMMTDITERKQNEAEQALYANVFHATVEGIVVTDMNGIILSVNQAFSDITGYSAEEAVGRSPSILKSDHHDPSFYRAMWVALRDRGRWSGEVWNRRKNGEVYLETQTISRIPDADGKSCRYVGIFNDVTESRQKDQRIMHLAFHDALTGLPNRLLIQDRLEHALTLATREHRSVAVMFIDLDRFKWINDTLGHDMGDALLQEVARRLRKSVRATDTVGRLGGDEFVVLLEINQTVAMVESVAEKILDVLGVPVDLNGTEVTVTPSIGISVFPQDGREPGQLMKNADTAMYEAKGAGRNTFRYFDPSMNDKAQMRLDLDNALRGALDRHEFYLVYQAKMDLDSNQAHSVEALIRWNRPGHGFIAPADFIPLLEENGLIVPLGYWIIDEACRQIADWRRSGLGDIKVAVNISARQLAAPGLVDAVRKALATHYVPASLLELELTETAVMSDVRSSSQIMHELKGLGVTLAVDDFGTGYSSLSYLRRLPIDTLKIDRSFINDLESSREDAEIIRTIISMGRTLNLSLVAEGVETEGQVDFLRDCSCGTVQGYYFSRPLDPGDFVEWIRARKNA